MTKVILLTLMYIANVVLVSWSVCHKFKCQHVLIFSFHVDPRFVLNMSSALKMSCLEVGHFRIRHFSTYCIKSLCLWCL